MANFYTDNEDLKFHLGHPLMKRIIDLRETKTIPTRTYTITPQKILKTLWTIMTK